MARKSSGTSPSGSSRSCLTIDPPFPPVYGLGVWGAWFRFSGYNPLDYEVLQTPKFRRLVWEKAKKKR